MDDQTLDRAAKYLADRPTATDGELATALWGMPGRDSKAWMALPSGREWGWRVSQAERRYIAVRRIRAALAGRGAQCL